MHTSLHNISDKSLTVESKVFGVRLGTEQLEALRDEVTNGPSVLVWISTGETLVGRVKEGEQFLALDNLGNLDPLVLGGVTKRVETG